METHQDNVFMMVHGEQSYLLAFKISKEEEESIIFKEINFVSFKRTYLELSKTIYDSFINSSIDYQLQ